MPIDWKTGDFILPDLTGTRILARQKAARRRPPRKKKRKKPKARKKAHPVTFHHYHQKEALFWAQYKLDEMDDFNEWASTPKSWLHERILEKENGLKMFLAMPKFVSKKAAKEALQYPFILSLADITAISEYLELNPMYVMGMCMVDFYEKIDFPQEDVPSSVRRRLDFQTYANLFKSQTPQIPDARIWLSLLNRS